MQAEAWILGAALLLTAIAALAIVKFGFYLRDRTVHTMEQLPESSAWAVVVRRYAAQSKSLEHPLVGMLAFRLPNGRELHLQVDSTTYNSVAIGQQGQLFYRNNLFLGFGEQAFQDSSPVELEMMDFSYAGYDEDMDREIPAGFTRRDMVYLDGKALSPKDRPLYRLYRYKRKLPRQVLYLRGEAEKLETYSARILLARSDVPSFLKGEWKLQQLFERVYEEAFLQLSARAGRMRRGKAVGSIRLRRSNFFLQLVLQESTAPAPHQVYARFFVNIR